MQSSLLLFSSKTPCHWHTMLLHCCYYIFSLSGCRAVQMHFSSTSISEHIAPKIILVLKGLGEPFIIHMTLVMCSVLSYKNVEKKTLYIRGIPYLPIIYNCFLMIFKWLLWSLTRKQCSVNYNWTDNGSLSLQRAAQLQWWLNTFCSVYGFVILKVLLLHTREIFNQVTFRSSFSQQWLG